MRVRAGQHEDQQRRKFYRKMKKSFGKTLWNKGRYQVIISALEPNIYLT